MRSRSGLPSEKKNSVSFFPEPRGPKAALMHPLLLLLTPPNLSPLQEAGEAPETEGISVLPHPYCPKDGLFRDEELLCPAKAGLPKELSDVVSSRRSW